MNVWELCIRRPIFTCMLVLAPVVMGAAAYPRLGVDLFPNVDIPTVVITTTLKGAGVEEMESSVTKELEEAVNTISGIDELKSTTKEGFSQIVIAFKLDKNGDVAAQEVRDKVSTIINRLPAGTETPLVDKFAVDAAPVMTIAVSGKRDVREVTELAKKQIKENLETIYGVGAVTLVGGRQRAINIILDVDQLAAYRLSAEDIRGALLRQNLEVPGGRVDQGSQELVLRTMGRIEKVADFENLIVADRNDYPVRLKDIGRVEDSYEEPRGLSRLDGNSAVSLVVQKQSGQNTVAVVHRVKEQLKEIRSSLPADINYAIIRDQSRFIESSIEEVKFHLVLAAVLVSMTILLFIRDWRTTIIATIAIPASMLPTFAFMMAMGYTLNNITMLGLILAIGIVIDDAVVVHENIFRHMEEYGRSAMEASRSATSEIATAVVATTISLLVIFVPVAFMQGQVGRFFNSFGFVVGFSILMSMFVSFTLTPMLCSRFLVLEKGGHKTSKNGWTTRLIEGSYRWILAWSLRHRWVIVVTSVLVLLSTPTIAGMVGFDFVPVDDQGEFEVTMTLPEGYSLQRADKLMKEMETDLKTLPDVRHIFTIVGDTTGRVGKGQGDVTQASIYVRLPDVGQRPYSQFDIMRQAREMMTRYPDIRTAVQDVGAISASGFKQVDVDLNIRGPELDELRKVSEKVAAWMKTRGSYVDVDTSLSLRKPELRVKIDRERASDLGVPIETVASTLNLLVGGELVGKYKEQADQYDVWVRADRSFRDAPETIDALMVPSPKAGLVKLSNLAELEMAQGPTSIERHSRQRQVVVVANLEGMALGPAVDEIDAYMKTLKLPAGYHYEFLGQAKMMKESNGGFLIAFGLSFLFMYMVLAAQFESFVHPITILLALPLTLPFAFLSLYLLRTPLDIYAMFGLFMLFGIVKKNGILQIDYTNVLRGQGVERDKAILDANQTRLRPILMTTLMLVAAMVPVAMGQGPGAGSRASMAKVIIGGQALSLLLTLLLTPVAYSLWDDFTIFFNRRILRRPITREDATGGVVPSPASLTETTVISTAAVGTATVLATPVIHTGQGLGVGS
ncbi:efflux RND transporter permease subunit [Anatilimnocola sp. NA78]|uniref:efflux RND transporter permease subunit n=1 Tax=Anatilimnocola sp. NA78 TaxID=3415683 RepID=UPI003CE5A6C0